ncbi:MAG TPA: phytoene desaturase family protein [Bacteroidia bacterium]|nr:phytoene desaturase family protein [Bacteroidia bacterium]
MAKVAVIGSGFSGLSAACFAAKQGHEVTVFEKNSVIGGRSRFYEEQGFMFDMGPSWYWMPDVFEKFFKQFDKVPSDYYKLVQLDPGFQLFFSEANALQVPAKLEDIYQVFESIEKGSAVKLKKFLAEGELKYKVGMEQLVYKPALSWMEFANYNVISGALKSHIFKSVQTYVRSFFKDERLIALMEFPVLFLGAMPKQIPALYSLMNYAALTKGTWYPMLGMYQVVSGIEKMATELGVSFKTNCNVEKINITAGKASSITTSLGDFKTDVVIASADYNHVEQKLIDIEYRNYSEKYWEEKTFAPSCLIYYVGVNKKINKLIHHNLFFDTDFDKHAKEIYETPQWPENPLFYVCCPSKTDATVAPAGMENLFILVPIAPGLKDTPEMREHYFTAIIKRIEKKCNDIFLANIIYKKTYCVDDFVSDYNAYKGNAYGLANTLKQTALLKPSIRNKKVKNLFYAGQLTVPGPGVPPALISGEIAATQMSNYLKSIKNAN